MYSLKAKDITKYFSRTPVFKPLSFTLTDGESLAVTGWNGSGKSTLLRIIAGLTRPTTGSVEMVKNGKMIPKTMKRKIIGMIAPAFSMYDELTGLENIEYVLRIRGMPFEKEKCLKLMRRLGINEPDDKLCRYYSSGMSQRLKLAQAVVHKPPLLLLDEPGSNLDSHGRKTVAEIIENQRKTGITLVASNEKYEVDYADRVINLSE